MTPASSALKASANSEVTEIPMLIGGEWRAAAESYDGARSLSRYRGGARAAFDARPILTSALNAAVQAKAKAAATPCLRTGRAVAPRR